MVQNKLWRNANNAVRLSKQKESRAGLVWVPLYWNSLCFFCVPAYNLFRTMWPDPAMGLFCNTNIVQEITNLTVNPPGLWLAFEQRYTWFQVTDVDFSIMRPWEEQLKRFEKLYSHVLCVVRAHARSDVNQSIKLLQHISIYRILMAGYTIGQDVPNPTMWLATRTSKSWEVFPEKLGWGVQPA